MLVALCWGKKKVISIQEIVIRGKAQRTVILPASVRVFFFLGFFFFMNAHNAWSVGAR